MIDIDCDGKITCPNCGKRYKPVLQRKTNDLIQVEFPKAKPWEREQLVSGICSDKCWNQFLGIPQRRY